MAQVVDCEPIQHSQIAYALIISRARQIEYKPKALGLEKKSGKIFVRRREVRELDIRSRRV